jgi:hypothetical protein
MSSRNAARRYSLLVMLGVAFTPFEIISTTERVASAHEATTVAPAVTFTIPLATLDDVRKLDHQAVISEVIHTARYYSDSPIFLAAYVTADDVRAHHAGIAIADLLVIEMGGYLASRGVQADRISGKGMGIDSAIGRAVVVSFGNAVPPSRQAPRALQLVRSTVPERGRVLPAGRVSE